MHDLASQNVNDAEMIPLVFSHVCNNDFVHVANDQSETRLSERKETFWHFPYDTSAVRNLL